MTGFAIRTFAYLLAAFLFVSALLLLAYGCLRLVPGSAGNSLRRALFRLGGPWLRITDRWMPLRSSRMDWTAFLAAVLLLAFCRFAIPWLVLLGAGRAG